MHADYITVDSAVARLEAALPPVHGAPFWTMTRDIQGFRVTCYLPGEFAGWTDQCAGKFPVFSTVGATAVDAVNGAADQLDRVLTATRVVAA